MNKYQSLALEVLDSLPEDKIPIVCGGTNYYIESIMFEKEKIEVNFEGFDQKMNDIKVKHQGYEEIVEEFRVNVPIDNKAALEEKFDSAVLHSLL